MASPGPHAPQATVTRTQATKRADFCYGLALFLCISSQSILYNSPYIWAPDSFLVGVLSDPVIAWTTALGTSFLLASASPLYTSPTYEIQVLIFFLYGLLASVNLVFRE